jgi:hypothetical protein
LTQYAFAHFAGVEFSLAGSLQPRFASASKKGAAMFRQNQNENISTGFNLGLTILASSFCRF